MREVSVEGLVKRFGKVTAVDGISFHVPKGKMVTLLGPSGCGKTTTLNIIAGFENPDEGEVFVGDRLISSGGLGGVILPPYKRNLGMVFQSYGLWPHFSVADNVSFGLKMRKVSRGDVVAKVQEALRLVRLEGFGDRYPSQLSGGEQQRVAFARALVYKPDVLLLDEPLSNLDAALREEMRLELKELQQQTGITTLFVTHDQVEAMAISDQIVVLNQGRIEQVGTPEEIYETPANQFVASFIGVSNVLRGEISEVPDSAGLTLVRVGEQVLGCKIEGRSKGGTVLLSIRPEDWEVSLQPPRVDTPNVVSGKVEKKVYLGGVQELWLRVQDKQLRLQGYRLPSVEVGQSVWAGVRPEDIKIIMRIE